MTTLDVTQHRLPDHADEIAELTRANSKRIKVALSDVGAGGCVLALDDPALDDLRVNDILRFRRDGTEILGAALVEAIDEHRLDDQGAVARTATLSGRGIPAVTEWGLIIPANGLDALPIEFDRLFSWQAPQYDDTDWDDAVAVGLGFYSPRRPGAQAGYPDGAPPAEVDARWIWADPGTEEFAPGGRIYIRRTFGIGPDEAGACLIGYAFDNYGRIWIDGQELAPLEYAGGNSNYLSLHTTTVDLSEGNHTIAIEAVNVGPAVDPGTGHDNPGGVYCIVGKAHSDGEWSATLVVTTDDGNWKVLGYPEDPPGMTPGQALLIALTEMQGRGGVLSFVTATFDATAASDGSPWPIVGDISTKTGTDLLTFLIELSTTYIDWSLDPETLELNAYIKGDLGGGSAVALEPATNPANGNLRQWDRVRT